MAPIEIKQKRLVKIFEDVRRLKSAETRFCFLIGAGASVSSGIPSGSKFANDWYNVLKEDLDDIELEAWKNSINFDQERISEFYPQLYEKRYESSPQLGYEEFKRIMENKDPGLGYMILAQILAHERHNFVITTNFDYLIEDAVRMFTNKKPFSAGHENLAGFISSQTDRPTIIKVHRDLFLNPINDQEGTDRLKDEWKEALKPILKNFNLLVIGYGGNDGSLMDYLKELNGNERKSIYWCIRKNDFLNQKITDLLSTRDYLVEIEDFDQLMFALNNSLEYRIFDNIASPDDHEFVLNAKLRIEDLGKKLNVILAKIEKHETKSKKENYEGLFTGVYDLIYKTIDEPNPEKKEKIFRQGFDQYPNNPILLGSYALFLYENEYYEEAEEYFLNAIELDPKNAINLGNYFLLLEEQKRYEEAEEYSLKAIEADPADANNLGNYAFLLSKQERFKEAKEFYLKAIKANPSHANNLGNYALLLEKQDHFKEAEEFYLKAIEADPADANVLGNYALFLDKQERYKEAEEFYLKAIEADPADANVLGNYAHLKLLIYKDHDEAKDLIDKAFLTKAKLQPILAELWFYRYAHYEEYFVEGEKELKKLIKKGAKSHGWDLQSHVDLAIKNDHPHPEKLQEFADAITKPD